MSHQDRFRVGFCAPSDNPKRCTLFDKPDKSHLQDENLDAKNKSGKREGQGRKRLSKASKKGSPYVMSDIKEFTSPLDGKQITSRSQLRAHEVEHNVRQAGDFKPGELIAKREKHVARVREGAKGGTFKWY